ncbi:MAG: hypothetical protein GX670_03605, partial [Bacteroidales bacterium]|nr:hypothetical protein [Bacteroidales bacterium]
EEVNINLNVNLDGVYKLRDVINETQEEVKSKDNILNFEMGVESKNVKVIEIKR